MSFWKIPNVGVTCDYCHTTSDFAEHTQQSAIVTAKNIGWRFIYSLGKLYMKCPKCIKSSTP